MTSSAAATRWTWLASLAAVLLLALSFPAPAGEDDVEPLATSPSRLWNLRQCTSTGASAVSVSPVEEPEIIREVDQTGYVKGLYLSYGALHSEEHITRVRTLIETTELNAVVIDVKDDRGAMAYPSDVWMVHQVGMYDTAAFDEDGWKEFMKWFEDRGVYTIARIVTFKDEPLATTYPQWAVTDSATGGVWRDGEGLPWADPYYGVVHEYNIELAKEAVEKGFDEIQFDYVRFPSDGSIGRAQFVQGGTQANRVGTIAAFLRSAKAALEPLGVKVAADVFGYVCWLDNDLGIGQFIEDLAPNVDVLAPMLYPSTFSMGLPGQDAAYSNAIAYPYEIVYESTIRMVARAKEVNPDIEIRPWIQDFQDYAFDGRHYTPAEIRAQMDGGREAGGRGYMLWNPAVIYTPEALVSALPAHAPNTMGDILVVGYQRIVEGVSDNPDDASRRSPAAFRADLDRLLASGYYPINLSDLVGNGLSVVPAGKRPVVLTFDGSTLDQFRLLPDGTIDPDCAVGILRSMHQANMFDWPLRGTFFVRSGDGQPESAIFGQPDLTQLKLATLVAWGMDVGVSTTGHVALEVASEQELQRILGSGQAWLETVLPGYEVASLALPIDTSIADSSILQTGQHNGQSYSYGVVVQGGSQLARSPRSAYFQPTGIPRVQASQSELDYWLCVADQPGFNYL